MGTGLAPRAGLESPDDSSPGIAGGVRQNRKGTVHPGHGVILGSRVIRESVRPARFADLVDQFLHNLTCGWNRGDDRGSGFGTPCAYIDVALAVVTTFLGQAI